MNDTNICEHVFVQQTDFGDQKVTAHALIHYTVIAKIHCIQTSDLTSTAVYTVAQSLKIASHRDSKSTLRCAGIFHINHSRKFSVILCEYISVWQSYV